MHQFLALGDRIDNLRAAQADWAAMPVRQRLVPIAELRRLLAERAPAFVETAARRLGKSKAEFTAAEILPLIEACRFLENRAQRLLAARHLGWKGRPAWLTGSAVTIHREPLGCILIIGPSNYPLMLPGIQALQALVAGNVVVVKPGAGGSEVMHWLIDLLEEANLPPNLIMSTGEHIDDAHAALRARIDKVILTGSNATGRAVMRRLAERTLPSVMELSGNDPMILLPDADIDMAVRAIAYGLRLNGSATCIAPRRIIAIDPNYEPLREKLLAVIETIPSADVPLVVQDRLRQLLNDSPGCKVHGALPPDAGPMQPMVVEGVTPDAPVACADIFAPVTMLFRARDVAEAVAIANASPYGLGASIFGPEHGAAELALQLDAGSVCVNDLIVPTADPRVPFAGRKQSGFGATRGGEGLLEMTQLKAVIVRQGKFRPHFDPTEEDEHEFLLSYIAAVHGRSWTTRLSAGMRAARHMIARGMNTARKRT